MDEQLPPQGPQGQWPQRLVPPTLDAIHLHALPMPTHNLSWSPDLELAVGVDDSIFIYVCDFSLFPPPPPPAANSSGANNVPDDSFAPSQYAEPAHRFPIVEARSPALNAGLYAAMGRRPPSDLAQRGRNQSVVGGGGSRGSQSSSLLNAWAANNGGGVGILSGSRTAINHLVALEWSPTGLGRMKRAVLAVLTSDGALTVYGEGAPDGSGGGAGGADALISPPDRRKKDNKKPLGDGARRTERRSVKPWVAPWSVGAGASVPKTNEKKKQKKRKNDDDDDDDDDDGPDEDANEYITSFAWARGLGNGKGGGQGGAILAYVSHLDEIVILAIQSEHDTGSEVIPGDPGRWRVEEVARFAIYNPHPPVDPTDPDYCPSGTSFALSWSPWYDSGDSRMAILSYVTKNHIGFRRIAMENSWEPMTSPKVTVDDSNLDGICMFLAPDAFVVWEDQMLDIDDAKVCRGLVATPAKVSAFEIPLLAEPTSVNVHYTNDCGTTYPAPEESEQAINPITGLIIHPPSLFNPAPTPLFTLTRLSATHSNKDWHQTNLAPSVNTHDNNNNNNNNENEDEDENNEDPNHWATDIRQSINHRVPRSMAYRRAAGAYGVGSDLEEEPDSDTEKQQAAQLDDDDESDEDAEYDGFDDEGEDMDMTPAAPDIASSAAAAAAVVAAARNEVYVYRMRIWGIARSPGGGTTAVFVSRYGNVRPERDTYSGVKCRVLFGRHFSSGDEAGSSSSQQQQQQQQQKQLTAEGRRWEWMYGGGEEAGGAGEEEEEQEEQEEEEEEGTIVVGGKGNRTKVDLKSRFARVAETRECAFCSGKLNVSGRVSRCGKGHAFEKCAATGVPILSPGISKVCNVCGSRCLKPEELLSMAELLFDDGSDGEQGGGGAKAQSLVAGISRELCGGCGGKFVN